MAKQMTRREMLGTTAAVTAATWAGANTYAAGGAAQPGPNETLNLALIGCGARGRTVMRSFQQLPGTRIAAVCDVHSEHLAQGRQQAGGNRVDAYTDFRKIMDRRDIDAVIVATQAHWHVPMTIAACQAGKDVYLEKPLGNSIFEGQFAIRAAQKYGRIVQIGTQQRSRAHYQLAVDMIRSGKLGEISEVKVWDYENWWPGRGSPADCAAPKELDWDFYVGPAPLRNYNPNIYYDYGYDWFKLSGGGHQVAWGVHHFDTVLWAMNVRAPVAVSAVGGNYAFEDNREWPNTLTGILQFGPGPVAKRGFVLHYDMRIGCRRQRRSHAKCFHGSEASMLLDRSRISIVREVQGGKKVAEVGYFINREEEFLAEDDELRHSQVFLDNVRQRRQPLANLETGHDATNLGHLLNISWQVGRTIRWDREAERPLDDAQANQLVEKPYRAPWKLEV
jgi:predicted dehydrogenase